MSEGACHVFLKGPKFLERKKHMLFSEIKSGKNKYIFFEVC